MTKVIQLESEADEILKSILDIKSAIAVQELEIQTLTEKNVKKIEELQKELKTLTTEYESELKKFASKQLIGKTTKMWKGKFGSLSFRTVKGGIRISDPEAALSTVKNKGWFDSIKVVETVQISTLNSEQLNTLAGLPGFKFVPDSETFSIKVGVN